MREENPLCSKVWLNLGNKSSISFQLIIGSELNSSWAFPITLGHLKTFSHYPIFVQSSIFAQRLPYPILHKDSFLSNLKMMVILPKECTEY